MNNTYLTSSELLNSIKEKAAPIKSVIVGGFELIESPLFPFEIMYDACDVVTKREIKIPSGLWIHGCMVPKQEPISVGLMCEPPTTRRPFMAYMEETMIREWQSNPYCLDGKR